MLTLSVLGILTSLLFLPSSTAAPAIEETAAKPNPTPLYAFRVFQEDNCPKGAYSFNVSSTSSQSQCGLAPEFGFRAVKVEKNNGGKCVISFVNDNQCTDVLASTADDVPADGSCYKLPRGVLTYAVECS